MTENVLAEDKYGKSALSKFLFLFFFFEKSSLKFSVCPLRMNRLKACM